jgi:hypothetical protein
VVVGRPKLAKVEDPAPLLKLDLGCGPNKLPGYVGVDIMDFPAVDVRHDLTKPWPWKTDSVAEVHSSHFVEHLTGAQRIPFFNELYRVLQAGAQARIICPIWSHERAYGDPTHQWPPVSTWSFFYLNKAWRDGNAPHVPYTCDFDHVIVGTHDPNDQYVSMRNMETKVILMSRSVNTTTDIVATLTKRA